jgi:hypothetical protein
MVTTGSQSNVKLLILGLNKSDILIFYIILPSPFTLHSSLFTLLKISLITFAKAHILVSLIPHYVRMSYLLNHNVWYYIFLMAIRDKSFKSRDILSLALTCKYIYSIGSRLLILTRLSKEYILFPHENCFYNNYNRMKFPDKSIKIIFMNKFNGYIQCTRKVEVRHSRNTRNISSWKPTLFPMNSGKEFQFSYTHGNLIRFSPINPIKREQKIEPEIRVHIIFGRQVMESNLSCETLHPNTYAFGSSFFMSFPNTKNGRNRFDICISNDIYFRCTVSNKKTTRIFSIQKLFTNGLQLDDKLVKTGNHKDELWSKRITLLN